jgi:hypothetical protein
MENWKKLCSMINPLIEKGVDEDIFHNLFESCLRAIFNWDDDNCIKHKHPVQMGRDKKEADIVLKSDGFGIVIEMKKPSIELGGKEVSQLTSYMRFLRYKYGMLVGNKIKIFYDDDTNNDDPLQIASFSFDVTNKDGIDFCNILDKAVCSNEKLKAFAIDRINRIQTEKEMEKLKSKLVEDEGKMIKQIIREKYISEGYEEKSIDSILNDIVISSDNMKYNRDYGGTDVNDNQRSCRGKRKKRSLTQATRAETYHFLKASLKIKGENEFVLLRGSKLEPEGKESDEKKYKSSKRSREKHKKLISESLETLQDISFESPSGAANFVNRKSNDGWTVWKTSAGKSIDDIITEK